MSRSREDLQLLLEDILGSENVYFQPPANVRMRYPAIVYSLYKIMDWDANDSPYVHHKSYTITLIDQDPDSEIVDKLTDLQYCEFDRAYASDHLNHFVFKLFY